MSLINIQDGYLAFSNLKILNNTMLYINENERVCLTGKNGTGKSTLLKVINKTQDLDFGQVIYQKNIKISYLNQENPKNCNISIYDFISLGLHKKYANKNQHNCVNHHPLIHENIIQTSDIIEIEKMIDQIQLDKKTLLSDLSGGLLRKVALGRILIEQPDVLLLDEPTNHLDMKTVTWLEKHLVKYTGSVLFVSHDRSFIQNICTRIVDLDRGKLTSWTGDYKNFIKLKQENNRIENIQKKLFDHNLEKEEKWIRKGVKARTTRNEGRVKNLKKLRQEYDDYKKIEKVTNITINQIENNSGKIIFKLHNISYSINNTVIIKNFSSIIQHGDKLGLIGNNGCGKSTIIKIIVGEKKPDQGEVHIGTGLKIAYFDQNRSILDPNQSIIDNIAYGKEKIILNGRERYLIGYLKSFLFQPKQLTSLVKTLSGGECNRLLLARLFLQPSNVLILDEPTNDLDLDTLQLLERIIIDYKGTIILVSHDKEFIQNTVNKCWFFKGNGILDTHIGNNIILKNDNNSDVIEQTTNKNKRNKYQLNIQPVIKLKKNNKKELNKTLNTIGKIELNIKKLQIQMNTPNFFKQQIEKTLPVVKLLNEKEKELKEQLKYWEKLENGIKNDT